MNVNRKWVALLVLGLFVLAAAIFGYVRWRHAQWHIETEDAYVKGDIYSVASRIPGTLLTLEVRENQAVKAGQTIATIDPRDYDARQTASLHPLSTQRLMRRMARITSRYCRRALSYPRIPAIEVCRRWWSMSAA